ncbi:MAG: hypothetical protein F6K10_09760 [Moorea sp. SIO2B7]|nr:hypothetical protein [Moorena sp. SIO2B7]
MQSATAKMLDLGNRSENFLEVSRGTLTKTVEEIRNIVKELEKDVNKVEQAEKLAEQELGHQLNNFLEITKKLFDTIKIELRGTLKNYFKYGKLQEESESRQKLEEEQKLEEARRKFKESFASAILFPSLARLFDLLLGSSQYQVTRRTIFEFDPSNPRITFNSEQDAKYFVEKINQEINLFTNDAEQKLEKCIRELSKDLEQKIPDVLVENVGDILEEAEKKLDDKGFSVNFRIPQANTEQNQFDFSSLVLASIEDKTEEIKRTEIRKKEGFWKGKVSRGGGTVVKWGSAFLWQPKWGYEEVSVTTTKSSYIVDMEKLQKNLLEDLDNRIINLGSSNQNFLKSTIKPIIDNYFTELKNYLQEFRGSMIDTINNHRLNEEDTQELIKKIIDVKKKITSHYKDVEGIEKGLKEIK